MKFLSCPFLMACLMYAVQFFFSFDSYMIVSFFVITLYVPFMVLPPII